MILYTQSTQSTEAKAQNAVRKVQATLLQAQIQTHYQRPMKIYIYTVNHKKRDIFVSYT